jgi:hypothetical protein
MGCLHSAIEDRLGESQAVKDMEESLLTLNSKLFDVQRWVSILREEATAGMKLKDSFSQTQLQSTLNYMLQYQMEEKQLRRLVGMCITTITNLKLKRSTKFSTEMMKGMKARFRNYDLVASEVETLDNMQNDMVDDSAALLDSVGDMSGFDSLSLEELISRCGLDAQGVSDAPLDRPKPPRAIHRVARRESLDDGEEEREAGPQLVAVQ